MSSYFNPLLLISVQHLYISMLSLALTLHTCLIALKKKTPEPISVEFTSVEHTKKDDFLYLG